MEVPSEYLRKKPLAITWDGVAGSLETHGRLTARGDAPARLATMQGGHSPQPRALRQEGA